MANPLRGEVEIALGGETLTLRPTFGAIMEIEDRLGGIVPLASRAAAGDFGLRDVAVIVRACLNAADGGSRSLDEVGERIMAEGVANVTPAVSALLAGVLSGHERR